MQEGFHGRTLGALSATGLAAYRDPAYPLAPRARLRALRRPGALAEARPATTSRPCSSSPSPRWAGSGSPTAPTSGACARSATSTGALLVFDEVQTGFGRTGHALLRRARGRDARPHHGRQGHRGRLPGRLRVRAGGPRGADAAGRAGHDLRRRAARLRRRSPPSAQAIVEEDLPARAARVGAILRAALERRRRGVGARGRPRPHARRHPRPRRRSRSSRVSRRGRHPGGGLVPAPTRSGSCRPSCSPRTRPRPSPPALAAVLASGPRCPRGPARAGKVFASHERRRPPPLHLLSLRDLVLGGALADPARRGRACSPGPRGREPLLAGRRAEHGVLPVVAAHARRLRGRLLRSRRARRPPAGRRRPVGPRAPRRRRHGRRPGRARPGGHRRARPHDSTRWACGASPGSRTPPTTPRDPVLARHRRGVHRARAEPRVGDGSSAPGARRRAHRAAAPRRAGARSSSPGRRT